MDNKISVGRKVKIIKLNSAWFGKIVEVISQGNGTCWQVDVGLGIGVYYFERELELIK
jgi:hypothetical protein